MADGRRTPVRTKLGALLMLIGLISGTFSIFGPRAEAAPVNPGTVGGFEIDGDQSSPAGGTVDWVDFKDAESLDVLTDAVSPDDGLQGSSSENDPELFACQDKSPTVTPGKDNLERAYINTRVTGPTSMYLDLAFVRSEGGVQGDSHVNFEFNQNEITSLCPYASRAAGDILISFDFPGNTADPANVAIYKWDPSIDESPKPDGAWVSFPFTGAVAAEDNASTITDELVGGTVAPRAFGEASIDLYALLQAAGSTSECTSFGFASIRSRSSGESFSSALQDIMGAPVDITTCGRVVVKKVDDKGDNLAGATFGLWPAAASVPAVGAGGTRPSTGSVATCTSVADGTCTFEDVEPGSYKVAELTPPSGYDIDPDVVDVVVGFRETVTVQAAFVDPRDTGSVMITKRIWDDKNADGDVDAGEIVDLKVSAGVVYHDLNHDGTKQAAEPVIDLTGVTFTLQQGGVTSTTWPGGAPAQCTIPAGALSCTVGPVVLGSYTIVETVDPAKPLPSGVGIGPNVVVNVNQDDQTVAATYTNPVSPLNIDLQKSGPATANIGQTFTYTFNVSTTGPRLHDVTVVELLPERCNAGPLTGPNKSTAVDPDNDADAYLEVGEVWQWTCDHLVTPADGTTLHNEARATGTDDIGRQVSDDDPHDVTILYPDLEVVKLAADGVDADGAASADETIDAPGTASYSIVVTNNGSGVAQNATLTDTLPAGSWTVTLASPDGDDVCPTGGNPKSGSFTCTFGNLAAGASKTVTVSRATVIGTSPTAPGDCAATLENEATVATTFTAVGAAPVNIDADTSDNTSSATINVRCPDVGVVKSATNTPISAGQRAEWTITVTNNGAGVAADVNLTDTLPAGLTDLQENSADCSISGSVLSCDFNDLPPNDGAPGGADTRTVTVSGLTDAADCGTLPNTATVVNGQGGAYVDSNAANNSSTANVVVQCPNIGITKTAGSSSVSAGEDISFTITVSNTGPGTAFGVTLSDPLPSGSGISWTDDSTACTIAGGVLSCTFGDLASGASASVTVTSPTTEASCKAYPNTATADATNDEPVEASASTTVQCPDISITKVADDDVVTAGDEIGFTITVSNSGAAGTGTASGVTLSDPLPTGDGISWAIDDQDGGAGCAIAAGTLTCGPVDLAPGASFSVHVTSDTDPTGAECIGGTLDNTAVADADNDAQVQASDSVTIQCPNLQIEKGADDASVSAGEDIGFEITVTNAGPGVAYGVTLSDPLPGGDGIDWSVDGESGDVDPDCSISGAPGAEVLSCGPVDLAAGESFTVHVTSGTEPSGDECIGGELENLATADADNDGQVSDGAEVSILCPGLGIVKTADDDTVTAGDEVGFGITVSNSDGDGIGTALGVTLEDPLPAGDGIDWSVDGESGDVDADCQISGAVGSQVLSCGPVDLEPGQSFTVHVTSDTDPSGAECAGGVLKNLATADADNAGEETDDADVTIQCPDLTITKVADADVVDAGDEIGFTITVFNAGSGIARDVVISDTLPSSSGVTWSEDSASCVILLGVMTCEVGDLAPGGSFSVHVTATTPGEIGDPDLPAACKAYDNTATVSLANDADESASDSTEVICPLDITIEKDGPDLAHRGDEITYTFEVTNSGEADLVEVELTDPICDDGTLTLVDDADGDTTLAVGEVWTYECTRVITETDPDPLPNTATVVGTDVRNRTTDDEDDHLVDIITPVIDVVKTVDDETPDVGQTVTFTYVVTNTGDTTLFDVSVVDDKLGPIGTIDQLEPGESATLTKTMVVAADSPPVNIATASGTDVLGKTVTDDDPATITIVLPNVINRPPQVQPVTLPRTGADSDQLMVLAGVLLVLGGLLVAGGEGLALRPVRRRRR